MPIYEKLMGNPFVDVGVSVICEWLDRHPQPNEITTEDLKEVVQQIVPLYCEYEYRSQIRFIFPNSTLTQHSKIQKGIQSLNEELGSEWLHQLGKVTDLGDAGDCMGCGRRNAYFRLKKTEVPLTGSGSLRNFFPLFAEGSGYCAACTLAIQFAPLGFVRSGGKFLTLHSNSWKAISYWTRTCIADIISRVAQNEFTGFFDPKESKAQNALFYMIRRMIEYEADRSAENITMQVYSFSNDNRKAELDMYHLPARVFNFLRYVHRAQYAENWYSIVRSGYRRQTRKGFQDIDLKNKNPAEVYQKSTNLVYNNLLQDKSILGFFMDKLGKKTRSNWELLSLYLKEVRKMELTQLEKIKQVGDLIAECIQKSGRDRRLKQLEGATSYGECRNILRYVIRDRIQQGAPEPLFSIDDYMEHLFPASDNLDLTPWRETRDLLLFRIYEKLHKWLLEEGHVDFDDNTSETDDNTEEDN